jgi:hypothetical protein
LSSKDAKHEITDIVAVSVDSTVVGYFYKTPAMNYFQKGPANPSKINAMINTIPLVGTYMDNLEKADVGKMVPMTGQQAIDVALALSEMGPNTDLGSCFTKPLQVT